jgi:hypothetical protein
MTPKEKAARAATRTASDTAFDKANSSAFDPVKGWYSLGQAAKDRQQKTLKNTGRYGKGVTR